MTTKNNDVLSSQVPESPLEKIALSMSGGGYRAASFHLGGMAYLNTLKHKGVPLLEKVEMISTVSGGTIPGVVYTLMLQDGKTFEDFFDFLLEKLETQDLVATGIDKLNPQHQLKNPNKAKNLINAFAEQYDEHFTNGFTLDHLKSMRGHLKAVVFNATEFTNAINFRFRNPDSRLRSGNDAFRISQAASSEIKLSDVIASSSCFPGGFEPLLWPDDYLHDHSPNLQAIKAENVEQKCSPAGIMDGGIYDNQGVESILMYKGGLKTPYFDLVIVSDVASPDMNAYKPFQEESKGNDWKALTLKSFLMKAKQQLKRIGIYLWCANIGLLLLPLFWGYENTIATGLCLMLALICLLLIAGKYFVQQKVVSLYAKGKKLISDKVPSFFVDRLAKLDLGELSIHRIQPLLINRATSLFSLMAVVFLKVVRRLNYKRLYEQPNYDYRRTTTLIKELTEKDWCHKHPKGNYSLEVGVEIKTFVEQAASFGTTLWFTEEEKLSNMLHTLIISGQVTMCYNLKVYLEELIQPANPGEKSNGFDVLPSAVQQDIFDTLERCRSDWKRFVDKPDILFSDMRKQKVAKS